MATEQHAQEFQLLRKRKVSVISDCKMSSHQKESFLLSSLKEIIKLWGSGHEAIFQLECKDKQVRFNSHPSLGLQLIFTLFLTMVSIVANISIQKTKDLDEENVTEHVLKLIELVSDNSCLKQTSQLLQLTQPQLIQ